MIVLYGSEENEIGILRRTEISMVTTTCGVLLKDRKRIRDLMQMLDFNETIVCLKKCALVF